MSQTYGKNLYLEVDVYHSTACSLDLGC